MSAVDREHRYPWSDGSARREDPTYGRIDRDIQWHVDDLEPSTLGDRAVLEANLQQRRDQGLVVLGVMPRTRVSVVPVRRRHGLPPLWRWGLVFIALAVVAAFVWWSGRQAGWIPDPVPSWTDTQLPTLSGVTRD